MQFTDEPKRCHHTEPCDNEGIEFQDCTCGPLYDPRWFCPVHVDEAREALRQRSAKGKLVYQRSVVENLKTKLKLEQQRLSEMEESNE